MDAPNERPRSENPYAPPATLADDPEVRFRDVIVPKATDADVRRAGKRSLALFGVSISIFTVAALALDHVGARTGLIAIGFALSAILGLGASGFALVTLIQFVRAKSTVSSALVSVVAIAGGVGGFFLTAFGFICAIFAGASFSRGRQLRRRGKILLPEVDANDASWSREKIVVSIPETDRASLANAWRENGRTEHASVAAFARLTLDLMALGAPPSLVAASNRDALDEIRHTELCFSLARALDGRDASPAAFPEAQSARTLPRHRTTALAMLAVDSMIDGALHEGVSARVVAKLAKRCESPAIRAVLKEIASDEGRHAAHGWDVVAWCLEQGGANVAHALRGALAAVPESMHADLPADAESGEWEKYGIMGRELEAQEHAKTRADLLTRILAMTARYLDPEASSSTTHVVPSLPASTATPKRSRSGDSMLSRWDGLA